MTTGKLASALAAAGALALVLAGCGDRPMVYRQGEYQGKPDTKPWANAQFKDDQVEWEKAIKARTRGQDEYSRTAASAK